MTTVRLAITLGLIVFVGLPGCGSGAKAILPTDSHSKSLAEADVPPLGKMGGGNTPIPGTNNPGKVQGRPK